MSMIGFRDQRGNLQIMVGGTEQEVPAGFPIVTGDQIAKMVRAKDKQIPEGFARNLAVYDSKGRIIAPVPYEYMTQAERADHDSQTVKFAPRGQEQMVGKTLAEVKRLRAEM